MLKSETVAWEANIAEFLDLEAAKGEPVKVTLGQVAVGAVRLEIGRVSTADQRRISAVMKHLGWGRGKREAGTARQLWVKV